MLMDIEYVPSIGAMSWSTCQKAKQVIAYIHRISVILNRTMHATLSDYLLIPPPFRVRESLSGRLIPLPVRETNSVGGRIVPLPVVVWESLSGRLIPLPVRERSSVGSRVRGHWESSDTCNKAGGQGHGGELLHCRIEVAAGASSTSDRRGRNC
jgi:hypothetical protein